MSEPEQPQQEPQDLVSSVLGDARPASGGPSEGGSGAGPGGGRKKGIIVAAIVIGLVMLFWVAIMMGSERKGLDPEKVEGKPAPDFTLPYLFQPNQTVTLSELQGSPVFLNFWASWCGPCKDEGPVLADAYRRWKGSGIEFLGVDVQDSKKWGQEFERNYGIGYDSAFDETGEQYRNWGLTGFPETFLVDAEGKIIAKKIGAFYEPAEIDEYLSLLAPGFTPKPPHELSPIPEPAIPEQPDQDQQTPGLESPGAEGTGA